MNISRERWKQIDALFDAALDRPPSERDAFLREQCDDDPELYRSVKELLAASEAPDSLLETPLDRYAQALWKAIHSNNYHSERRRSEDSPPKDDEDASDA